MAIGEVVRTSLEVGFPGELPERYARYRGRETRSIPLREEFPYEDAQFEVVLMDTSAVSAKAVREAHRVLRPNGRLFFTVPERTRRQPGYQLSDIYAIVREGFNIVRVDRPAWWLFGRHGRTLSICAEKKKFWKSYQSFIREGSIPVSPFQNRG